MQLANGLPGWQGACPPFHEKAWGTGDLAIGRAVAMQRLFRARPVLYLPNLPPLWYQSELAHPTNDVVFCEGALQAARLQHGRAGARAVMSDE